MDLENVVDKLLKSSLTADERALGTISAAEQYLQQAYEGRYFFELIQNARDANKEIEQDGEVIITLMDNVLSIANTGAEFSQKGIDGITTIGSSTKSSQDFIGFKGIGFKSVQDVTLNPKIITKYGSVVFDKSLTLKQYDSTQIKLDEVPLFYFPYYREDTLSSTDIDNGIVTRIELPIKETIKEEDIIAAFLKINARQLILLGNIRKLAFTSHTVNKSISIHKDERKKLIEVIETDQPDYKYRYFSPSQKIVIPDAVIESLEGKEKEIFSKNSHIDINIVIDLEHNNRIKIIEDSKLYLFYPLKISSGFRFIIHSYFIVNPERTALRDSPLNKFLLQEIGKFIGDSMLQGLKKLRANTTTILCFARNKDVELDPLYDSLVMELKDKNFIYDNKTKRYFSPKQVIVADGFDKGLFPDGKFSDRQLVYTEDKDVIEWLQNEFDVSYLTYADIAKEIEGECQRQLKLKNIKFFQNLYNYVTEHEELNLTGKKVLLTDNWKLVSSLEDVFYGAKKQSIKLAKSIQKEIYFIHHEIKITGFREGRSRTGITEFNTYELVRRLLKLFSKATIPNSDILNALYNLSPFDKKSEMEVIEKIKFPIQNSNKWVSPLTNPIYFDSPELRELYPEGDFIDMDVFTVHQDSLEQTQEDFLENFGVWRIPAVYIRDKSIVVKKNERRTEIIGEMSSLSSRPFYIFNDRRLDVPIKFTSWFTQAIIDNWDVYKRFIESEFSHKMKYNTSLSDYRIIDKIKVINVSHFIEILSTEKWLVLGESNEPCSAKDIIGINIRDYHQAYNKVIQKYLNLIPINYELKKEMISMIGLIHLNGESLFNHKELLNYVYTQYKENIPVHKDFIDFYNRILGKLVDYFYLTESTDQISALTNEYFLSINDITQMTQWEQANKIFYIDDKPNYQILPQSVKEEMQPHFTNRDKNTFGKIAGRIGIRFSKAIKKELIDIEELNNETLLLYFSYLPESIAILESMLEKRLDEYFEVIRNIRVFTCKNLKVRVFVSSSGSIEISVNHYVDTQSGFNIYMSNDLNDNLGVSEAIYELFISLLGRDLHRFRPELTSFLNIKEKDEYLQDYDILHTRITEIKNSLEATELTQEQKFWEAILSAKTVSERHKVFMGKTVNLMELSKALGVDLDIIYSVDNNFDYANMQNKSNIDILTSLFEELSLTLEDINTSLMPKITFKAFYETKILQIKNQFEHGFNALLFKYLKNKSTSLQSKYQDYLDQYKHVFNINVPINTLKLDPNEFFLKQLHSNFDFLEVSVVDLKKDYNEFNSISIFKKQHNLLKKSLLDFLYTDDSLEAYLVKNERRSLLYFENIENVSISFRQWYNENHQDNNTENDDLKDLLDNLIDESDNNKIEEISTGDIGDAIVSRKRKKSKPGVRFDGESNNENKKIVGVIAEMAVYLKLKSLYQVVNWVSKYASKVDKDHPGYNPEGEDGLGYDIEYFDSEGNKFLVEVKGKSDSYESFEITKNEVDTALAEKEYFKIIFVKNVMNKDKRRILDLGNIFMFDNHETFLNNKNFTAVYKNFEVRFEEK